MKNVDTREYLSVMEELIGQNETVTIPISGFSMNPFLADKRDSVMIKKPEAGCEASSGIVATPFSFRISGLLFAHKTYIF